MRYSICVCVFLVCGAMAVAGAVRAADDSTNKAKAVAASGGSARTAQGQTKAAPAELSRTAFDAPRQGEIAMENVNIRSGPGVGEKVIGVLRNGDHVTAVAQVGDWLEIEYPAKFPAWISKDYVDVVKESGDRNGTRIGKVNCPKVRIRASGDMTGKVLKEATRGDEVMIVGESGLWYKVVAPAGSRCYVHKNCVQLEPPKAGVPPAGTPEVASAAGSRKTEGAGSSTDAASSPAASAAMAGEKQDADVEAKSAVTAAAPAPGAGGAAASAASSKVTVASAPKTEPLLPISVESGQKPGDTAAKDSVPVEKPNLTASASVRVPRLPSGEGFVSEGILEKQTKHDAPVGYRLTKGGITTYYVRAAEDVDLEKAVGKLVGVKGRILPPPKGFAHQVLLAESVVAAE
ncbi:MAG: SH3 domain-containing protein [Planctomycetota bacterium]|nr:SH3 domain-containing protein [Planctomycetota bacterium]